MSLAAGDVFVAINPGLSGSEPHFHIVVHRTDDELIIVTYTTTEIEKARARCQHVEKIKFAHIDPETLVLTGPEDCASFTQACAINCNHVQMMSEETYTTRPAFRLLYPIKNPKLLSQIKAAIKKSPIVEEKIIRLL
jgi:hypothetical protein